MVSSKNRSVKPNDNKYHIQSAKVFIYWTWLLPNNIGPLNHVKDFLHNISNSGIFDEIIVFSNLCLKEILEQCGNRTVTRNVTMRSYLLFQVITFFQIAKKLFKGHQIFYFRYSSFLFLPIFLRLIGKSKIFIEVNTIPNQFLLEGLRRPFTKYLRKLLLWLYDYFLFKSVNLVTVCNVFRDNLLKNYGVNKEVLVVPNGAFVEDIKVKNINDAKVALKLDLNNHYCIYVGSLVYYEGVEFLVEAFQRFCSNYPVSNVVLLILGDGSLREKLVASVLPEYRKRVVFLGYLPRDQMRDYIAASDIGIYAPPQIKYGQDGQRGGSPLKIIDYLTAGRPILVPRSSYYNYVESEEIGYLYEPENFKSFSSALKRLISNSAERDRLGGNARRYAELHLDWKMTLSQLFAILSKEASTC